MDTTNLAATFKKFFSTTITQYKVIAREFPITLNELIFILRKDKENDYSLSFDDGRCIPSVRESFVPSSWLTELVGETELYGRNDEGAIVLLLDMYREET